MKIAVKKKAVTHYLLIYLLIASIGSVKYSEFHDYFIVINLSVFVIYFLTKTTRFTGKKNWHHLIIIGLFCVWQILITSGSFSILNGLYILSVFMIAYVAADYDMFQIYARYVKSVTFLAIISLVLYFISLTSMTTILNAFPLNNNYYMRSVSHGGWFYHYMEGYGRNPGIYTEPGLYQMLLLTALFILFFRCNDLSRKEKFSSIMILIITLVTTQSTTGYLGLIILFVGILLSRSTHKEKKLMKKIYFVIAIMLIFFTIDLIYLGNDSFIYHNFIDKLFDNNMRIDLSDNTGNARIQCMIADMRIFFEHPFGLGFEKYNEIWSRYLAYDIFSSNSSVGLTKTFAIMGFGFSFYILWFYISGFLKSSKTKIEAAILILMYLNTVLAQPALYFGCFTILVFMVPIEKRYKRLEKNSEVKD